MSIGTACAAHQIASGSTSTERRFIALLDADRDQLPHRLRQMVALLKEQAIDFDALLNGLLYWDGDQKRTQNIWARDFYRNLNHETETDNQTEMEIPAIGRIRSCQLQFSLPCYLAFKPVGLPHNLPAFSIASCSGGEFQRRDLRSTRLARFPQVKGRLLGNPGIRTSLIFDTQPAFKAQSHCKVALSNSPLPKAFCVAR